MASLKRTILKGSARCAGGYWAIAALGEYDQLMPCCNFSAAFLKRPKRRHFAVPVYRNINRTKEQTCYQFILQFLLSHKAVIVFYQHAHGRNIKVGSMVGTNDIGFAPVNRFFKGQSGINKANKVPSL
jgi:hypothetical protein